MSAAEFARSAAELAPRLLGARLVCETGGGRRSGRIVETEAYLAAGDPGCHAASGRTRRNRSMFAGGGVAYVYRIYGLHHCFNVVSGREGRGEAVLIRALEPVEGIDAMTAARGSVAPALLCRGPGRLVEALGIGAEQDGWTLLDGPLRVELARPPEPHRVAVGRRIGLGRGRGEQLALRFGLRGSAWLSRRFP